MRSSSQRQPAFWHLEIFARDWERRGPAFRSLTHTRPSPRGSSGSPVKPREEAGLLPSEAHEVKPATTDAAMPEEKDEPSLCAHTSIIYPGITSCNRPKVLCLRLGSSAPPCVAWHACTLTASEHTISNAVSVSMARVRRTLISVMSACVMRVVSQRTRLKPPFPPLKQHA